MFAAFFSAQSLGFIVVQCEHFNLNNLDELLVMFTPECICTTHVCGMTLHKSLLTKKLVRNKLLHCKIWKTVAS